MLNFEYLQFEEITMSASVNTHVHISLQFKGEFYV